MERKVEIEKKLKNLRLFITKLLSNVALYKEFGVFSRDIKDKLLPFCLLGKNMRGLLVLLSSNNENNNSYKVASALEILHSGLLIHDDIMDEDTTRRGNKCIHIQYQEQLNSGSKKDLYGISQAICLGDIAFFLAFKTISKLNCQNSNKIRELFSREMVGVGLGQMSDVFFGFSFEEPSLQEIIRIYKSKTARYSISTPIVLGMYLNNEKENLIELAFKAGEYLGIVFQMKDDELGIWGDTKITGKGVFNDVVKNKKTILRHLLFKSANQDEKLKLSGIFGNNLLTGEQVDYLNFLFEKYSVKEKHKNIMDKFYEMSRFYIDRMPARYADVFNFVYELNSKRSK